MTVAVFAAPAKLPAPAPSRWPGFKLSWDPDDGPSWDLASTKSGVFLHLCRGLDDVPEADWYTQDAAGVAGAVTTGWRVKAKEVYWDLGVYSSAGTQAWIEHDRALWRSLQPGRYGWWTVQHPSGEQRRLRLGFRHAPGRALAVNPARVGWARYEVYFSADDPFWHGPDVVVPGGGNDDTPFIDEAGAPPFHIAGGSPLSGMAVANPGDVEAWPVWEAIGPHPDLVVGLGSTLIECPPLSTGEHLVIDTSPWVRTVLVDGVDALDATGAADFAPVPAGGASTLAVSSSGSGTVTCRVSPRYYRAW